MKILQVIHGYPMRYNAGSEVYTQTLCQGLAERHEVHVFTREEDSFGPDFRLREERDQSDARVALHLVNVPRSRDRYRHGGVDQRFAEVLDRVKPDVVHIGHLNHLSTSLPKEAASRGVPIVYTLHDYWLMCPRGQFMQMHPADPGDLWAACDGQEDRKCAERCYARYFSGADEEREIDVAHWTGWVERRMRHVRAMVELVDLFIAPARYSFTDAIATSSGSRAEARLPGLWLRLEAPHRAPAGSGSPSSLGTSGRTSLRRGYTSSSRHLASSAAPRVSVSGGDRSGRTRRR